MIQSGIRIIKEDLTGHPHCIHGPTILFSRRTGQSWRNFYACSACRDRKECSFFMWEDEKDKPVNVKKTKGHKASEMQNFKSINHRKLFILLNKIRQLPISERMYCHSCDQFVLPKHQKNHLSHDHTGNITDHQLFHPSEFLRSLTNSKKEAQYLFSKTTVETIVDILQQQGYRNIICICAPRIHEFIQNECENMNSLLLDIDKRFLNFHGPLQFCLYNCFNNYFFMENSSDVFEDYLKMDSGKNLALVMDPPFGGRVELLADTLEKINDSYKTLNKVSVDIPMFWIFPYFNEPHIINRLPLFIMLDYKVNYENHADFQEGPKGRKQGSPIRIFTNVNPSTIKLPSNEGYKYCKWCRKWVSPENKHCKICNSCTSKDGRTYVHCNLCDRCVKPTWVHCEKCNRCIISTHDCRSGSSSGEPSTNNLHVTSTKRKNITKIHTKKKPKAVN